jgi:DNA-binding PadR family transcriptional regulator
MLKYILLGFLKYRAMTGYELKSIMDESTMHFWHAYHSQIYTTLRKLEADGLVSSELDDGDDHLTRRTYTLTEAGRGELTTWLNTPLTETVPEKEDLLVRIFFSAERPRQDVIDELRFQRQLHQRKLEHYLQISRAPLEDFSEQERQGAASDLPFWTSTIRFGIQYENMYLQWLDETLEQIERL